MKKYAAIILLLSLSINLCAMKRKKTTQKSNENKKTQKFSRDDTEANAFNAIEHEIILARLRVAEHELEIQSQTIITILNQLIELKKNNIDVDNPEAQLELSSESNHCVAALTETIVTSLRLDDERKAYALNLLELLHPVIQEVS